jgi:DNA helicase-2/ATP-dependent DNA helicase PcrA
MDKNILEDYLNNLNPEQRHAATLGNESAVILAAAGSGKTSTLTCRIAYLIGGLGIRSTNILAVTFTNKAAKEMLHRLNKMGLDTKSLWIGTFHGICNKILRAHATQAGLQKSFTIMDSSEQESFFKRMLRANGYDPKNLNVTDLLDKINGYKEVGWRSDQLKVNSQERTIYALYEKACINDNVVDFGELLLGCYELFKNNPHLSESYAEKFEHILVDEFQDTNELQYKWLKILASKHGNVFAVGDDDQCLVEGTQITTPNGKKNIETIKIGDTVLAKAGIKTIYKNVTNVFSKSFKGQAVELLFKNGIKVISTPEHNWFARLNFEYKDHQKANSDSKKGLSIVICGDNQEETHSLEYVTKSHNKVSKLEKIGMNMESFNGIQYRLNIASKNMEELIDIKDKVYETIENVQIKFKGNFDGYRYEQYFAKDLKPGMLFVGENQQVLELEKVSFVEIETTVYDLNIENVHNFFANGVLSHNSIYGFRGAKPENLNLLKKDFNAQVIKIEKNYRSDANILEAANAVISNNKNRQGKNLVPTRNGGNYLLTYEALNDEEESSFISGEIKRLRRANIPYRNMAILYRTNGQSRSIEKALNAMSIPYIVYGGFRFFDRQEVKHAMAYLRLAHNPKDNLAFLRVVNIPARAIGSTAVQKLEVFAQENSLSLFEACLQYDDKNRKKFQPFIDLVEHLVKICKGKSLQDMVKNVIVESGLEAMYENDKKEGPERLDNLYELISAAEVFMIENKNADIQEFLAFSSLESDYKSVKRDDNADVVKLMTVHASKGLEFDAVFISGLEEGLFPHANSIGEEHMVEEERRLMYVAITRAKTALYLSRCEERLLHGQRNHMVKSRFFREIPAKLIQKIK